MECVEVNINNDEGVVVIRKKTRIFPQPRVYVPDVLL